jgi:hypothetical protein
MTQNQKKIKSLPKPRIGLIVNIPIDFWPEYLELHDLEVIGSEHGVVICKPAHLAVEVNPKPEDNK